MRGLIEAQLAARARRSCLSTPLRFAIVGCGNISGPYGETAKAYPSVEIVGATDIDRELSAAFASASAGSTTRPSTPCSPIPRSTQSST